jgi:hypothetical protein
MGTIQNLVSMGSMQRAASMLDPVDIEAVTASRRAATSARQQKHRQKMDLRKIKQEVSILEASTDVIEEREQRRVAFASVSTLLECLKPCQGPMARKLVMERILSHSLIQNDLPNYILPQKDAMAQSQILQGLNKTLAEIEAATPL